MEIKPQKGLSVPPHLKKYKPDRKYISVDWEIYETIEHLWKHKIITLGCCSGHDKRNPNIVIDQCYSNQDIKKIEKIILQVDTRHWDIYQWRNVKVSIDNPPKEDWAKKKNCISIL